VGCRQAEGDGTVGSNRAGSFAFLFLSERKGKLQYCFPFGKERKVPPLSSKHRGRGTVSSTHRGSAQWAVSKGGVGTMGSKQRRFSRNISI
jgi:hypothetical protein